MDVLTKEHVLSLIDDVIYDIDPQVIVCKLIVGEAVIVGTSYCFSKATYDPERGKQSAYNNAIDQLFSLEAYHQKRLRNLSYADRIKLAASGPTESCSSLAKVLASITGNPDTMQKDADDDKSPKAEILSDTTTIDADGNFVGRDVTYKCPHTGAVGFDSISAPGIEISKFKGGEDKISPEEQTKAEELVQLQNRQTPAETFVPTSE